MDVNNLDFYSEDNCLINKKDTRDYKAGTALIRGCKNSKIPSGIKTIEPHAFFGCKSLKSITIPDTVTYIGFSSFEGCTSDGEQVRQTEIGPEAGLHRIRRVTREGVGHAWPGLETEAGVHHTRLRGAHGQTAAEDR